MKRRKKALNKMYNEMRIKLYGEILSDTNGIKLISDAVKGTNYMIVISIHLNLSSLQGEGEKNFPQHCFITNPIDLDSKTRTTF
jgi:hypothetical protein